MSEYFDYSRITEEKDVDAIQAMLDAERARELDEVSDAGETLRVTFEIVEGSAPRNESTIEMERHLTRLLEADGTYRVVGGPGIDPVEDYADVAVSCDDVLTDAELAAMCKETGSTDCRTCTFPCGYVDQEDVK